MHEKNTEFVYYSGEERGALYQDGKLVRYGEHYHLDEYLKSFFGVKEVMNEDFLRGGTTKDDVAQTLEEIEEWRQGIDGADWSNCLFEFRSQTETFYVPFEKIEDYSESNGSFTGRVIGNDHQLRTLEVRPSFLK